MAVYFQQYNPWREQLAGSILAPLLKLAIEGSQAANQSRKENAFIAEAMKEFRPQVDTSMPTLQGFQGPQPTNPWEQAASDGGLVQGFDPSFGAQAMQPQVRNIQDIQARLAELQASDRFNMLNPDRTRQLMAPMMDQYAAAENARRMQDFFAQFGEKQDPSERLMHLSIGAGMKYLTDRVTGDFVDLYKHQNPHQDFKLVDSGDRVTGYTFNPSGGTVREVLTQIAGMNPYQAGSLANERSRIGISAGDLGLAREKFDWERKHGGADGNYQFLQGPDGNFVTGNRRTGELTPTNIKGATKNTWERMSERDKLQYQSLLRQREKIIGDAAFMGHTPASLETLASIDRELQKLMPNDARGDTLMRFDTETGTFR